MELNLDYSRCAICPRNCNVDREKGQLGYCRVGAEPLVSCVVLHKGEEPVLTGSKGVCNVFFAHCNLGCTFCQNYQISCNSQFDINWLTSTNSIVNAVLATLKTGVKVLGFVSPSHQVKQMLEIIAAVQKAGFNPTIVYNSNGYDSVTTLKQLDGVIDVYLPDFKYFNNSIAKRYSDANGYREQALAALKEMYRQKGSPLFVDDEGIAESGLIVRHLVLPSHADDSVAVLNLIAQEVSSNIHVSLLSQFFPVEKNNLPTAINRVLHKEEYDRVVQEVEKLGFKGWVQDLNSPDFYLPDFERDNPFEY